MEFDLQTRIDLALLREGLFGWGREKEPAMDHDGRMEELKHRLRELTLAERQKANEFRMTNNKVVREKIAKEVAQIRKDIIHVNRLAKIINAQAQQAADAATKATIDKSGLDLVGQQKEEDELFKQLQEPR